MKTPVKAASATASEIENRDPNKSFVGDDSPNSPAKNDVSMDSVNSSLSSNWFENTHDEMVLYEKFGENYDEIVAKMSDDQMRKLRSEVRMTTPKSAQELLNNTTSTLEDIDESEELFESAVDINVLPPTPQDEPKTSEHRIFESPRTPEQQSPDFERSMTPEHRSPTPPTPKPRTKTPQKKKDSFSPRMVDSQEQLKMLRDDLKLALSPPEPEKAKTSPKVFKSPTGVVVPKKSPLETFRTPKATPSPSTPRPKKSANSTPHQRTPVPKKYPLYGNANTPSYLRPTSASKHRASPKKDPVTNETIDITICCRHGYAHTPEPEAASPVRRVKGYQGRSVVSPVAQYIKQGRNFKPKPVENKFETLPEARYKASNVALERQLQDDDEDDAVGFVVKHVGRERVRADLSLEPTETVKVHGKGQIPDDSTLELSVMEVKKLHL